METLLEKALLFENMNQAWEEVAENQGIAGVDNISIKRWRRNWEERLINLTNQVEKGQYTPSPLRIRKIPKKNHKEWRTLEIPTITDRVLQRAVLQILYPIFEPYFYQSSYGYRPNIGLKQAIERILYLREFGYSYVLDADIDDFFGNVDHNILLNFLSDDLPDLSLLPIIESWLDKMKSANEKNIGIPIGSPISPLLANIYLHRLDQFCHDNNFEIVRYADDFCIFSQNEFQLNPIYSLCKEILNSLGLKYEPTKTNLTSFEVGFSFIGVWFGKDTYEYEYLQKKIIVSGNQVDSLFSYYGPDY